MKLAEIFINDFDGAPMAEHNMPCAVCCESHAVYDLSIGEAMKSAKEWRDIIVNDLNGDMTKEIAMIQKETRIEAFKQALDAIDCDDPICLNRDHRAIQVGMRPE